MIPKIIEGGVFQDQRGSVSFVNDFKFDDIKRFYVISNSEQNPVRAWQGHKLDTKNFYCTKGSFRVSIVEIDNWENPSKDLEVRNFVLKASESKVLQIPAGYANAVQALERDSQLLSFCTLPLDRAAEDDVRYDKQMWSYDG